MSDPVNIANLFKKLRRSSQIHSVPSVYGTKRWPHAAMAELGPKVAVKESSNDHIKIQFPGSKNIEVTHEEFWEISCLSICEKHNAYYFDSKANIWQHERPWQALQEYNLMNCRENIQPEQEKFIYKILQTFSSKKNAIPFLSSLTYGWPWMFENSPGVWPPSEIINPRSCLYDPLLGILMFQDIPKYVESEGHDPLASWSLELTFCLAAHNIEQNPQLVEIGKQALRDGSHDEIQNFISIIEQALPAYHSHFDNLLEESEPEDACRILTILLLGSTRWLQCRLPFPENKKLLKTSKLLPIFARFDKAASKKSRN
jgi:hypothetical protein